ncbi:MAG TPA: DUF1236 domain-containing protein [Xanthobacteraceae bacterium]|nr:DUF1236 domain-containing protein [Xanthobacteraceae bacterium]
MRNLPVAAILSIPILTLSLAISGSCALAQSVGPNEAVGPGGAVEQTLPLTQIQKRALYQAVLRQRVRASTAQIDPIVGATVSRAVELSDLPDQAGLDDEMVLKYAMVQDDLVVVDPIRMRVVDIIHGSKP